METTQAARRRLMAAGYNFQGDGGGGFDIYRDGVRVGRAFSDAGLIDWKPPAANELAPDEQRALDQYEAVIARGVQTFLEVGEALASIRDDKLYRAGYATFDAYCRERWNIGRSRAYQLMGAAEIVREMSTQVDNPPTTEREARAVAQADLADRPRVLDRADQLAGDAPRTAKHVQQAVEEITRALPDVARFGFTARTLPNGGIGLRTPGDLESRHTVAHLAQLIAAWDAYPPIPADLAAVGVTWRYRTEKNYYQVMIGTGIGPTGYTPDELFADTRDRMRRLGSLPTAPAPVVGLIVGQRADPHQPDPKEPPDPMFDRPVGRSSSSFTSAEYEEWAETDQILLDKAANAIRRRDMDAAEALLSQVVVKTSARDELWAKLPDQAALWRTQAASLLRQLAPLLTQIRTEDRDGLSEAIADLNQCGTGQEVAGWLRVGWALLDLEPDA